MSTSSGLSDLELAALVSSRICHDVISPVGAIANGLEVLAEIDRRSATALFALLDVDDIADLIEEMPSDEGADVLGELDQEQAEETLSILREIAEAEGVG